MYLRVLQYIFNAHTQSLPILVSHHSDRQDMGGSEKNYFNG